MVVLPLTAGSGIEAGDAAAIASAAVLFVALLVALWQVIEARKLREAQARPFVVVDFAVEETLAYLTISNIGKMMAREVVFSFDQPLASTIEVELPISELKIFTEGIDSLPPGKTISTVFDSFIQRASSDLPDSYRVEIRYRGEGRRTYRDTTMLDLGIYRNLSRVVRRDLHDVHERLKKIADELHKWSAFGGGLLVVTPEDIQRRHREFERWRRGEEEVGEGESDAAK